MVNIVEEVSKGLKGIRLNKEDEELIMHSVACLPIPMELRKELSREVHRHVIEEGEPK